MTLFSSRICSLWCSISKDLCTEEHTSYWGDYALSMTLPLFKAFLEVLCWNQLQETSYQTPEKSVLLNYSYSVCSFVPTSFFVLIFSAVFLHPPIPHLLNHAELTVGHAGSACKESYLQKRHGEGQREWLWNQTKAEARCNFAPSTSWNRLLNLSLIAHGLLPAWK